MSLVIGDCLLQEQGKDAAHGYFERARDIALDNQNHTHHARALLGLSGNLQPIINEAAADLKNQLQMACLAIPRAEKQLGIRLRARVISYSQPVTQKIAFEAAAVVAEARALGDTKTLIFALLAHHECLRSLNFVIEQTHVSEELIKLTRSTVDRDLVIVGYLRRISDLLVLGNRAATTELRAEMETLQPRILFQDELNRMGACFSMMEGEFDAAEQHAMAISFRESGYLLMQFLQLTSIARYRDSAAQLLPLVESVAGDNRGLLAVHVYLALLYADCQKFEAFRAELEKVKGGVNGLNRDISWHAMLAALTEIAYLTDDKSLANELLDNLLPHQGNHLVFTTICYFGSAHFYLGLLSMVLGERGSARKYLKQSLKEHQQVSCVPMVKRSEVLLAAL